MNRRTILSGPCVSACAVSVLLAGCAELSRTPEERRKAAHEELIAKVGRG
jgi:hypothetical protein